MTMKVLMTDSRYPGIDQLERPLLEGAGFELQVAQCSHPNEVIEAGQGADALLVMYAPITRQVFKALPQIRMISRYGVGVDMIDLVAAEEFGVWVANVPDYGVSEVATHAFSMVLSLIRHLPFLDPHVREGGWNYQATGALSRPTNMTLGIVGHGRIGSRLAELAAPCFGRVLACDPYIPASSFPPFVERVDHDTLFQMSDAVSMHVPLTEETRHMVDRRRLALMPPGSYLVNTARGAVVDIAALLEALDGGHLAGAGLDVLPQEPPPADHPLLRHPRVLLSPHTAFYSVQALDEMRRKAAQNILSWAQRGKPDYVVVEGDRAGG